MFSDKNLVQNIRRIINDKGLKQKAIAIKCGKSEQDFSNMLNFRARITAEDLFYIANALDVEVNELYSQNIKS